MLGSMPYQARQLAFSLNLKGKQIAQFVHLVDAICRLFVAKDLALVEVNPLIITADGDLFVWMQKSMSIVTQSIVKRLYGKCVILHRKMSVN